MTLNQLRYFQKLAETGHMGRAANLLFISQPSLSVSISNLEKELGLPLFSHTGHKIFLTPEGSAFLTHTDKILREVDEAILHMQSFTDFQECHIRMGCISPLLRDYVPQKMRTFLDFPENKNVHFDFSSESTPELVRKLKNGIYDFLLCSFVKDGELSQHLLFTQPLVLLAPQNAPACPDTWEELTTLPLIGYELHSAMDEELKIYFKKENAEPAYICRAPNEDAIASLTEHGFGYAIVPDVTIFKNYAVSCHPLPSEGWQRSIYLTTLKNRRCAGAARRFITFLEG